MNGGKDAKTWEINAWLLILSASYWLCNLSWFCSLLWASFTICKMKSLDYNSGFQTFLTITSNLLLFVPSRRFRLLATLWTAEWNPAWSFCTILSSFSAVSDNALLLFIGFSWSVFSEVGGQVLLCLVLKLCWNLSTMGDPAGIWNTGGKAFSITATRSRHSMTTVRQMGDVVPWLGNKPRPRQWEHLIVNTRSPGLAADGWYNVFIFHLLTYTESSLVILCLLKIRPPTLPLFLYSFFMTAQSLLISLPFPPPAHHYSGSILDGAARSFQLSFLLDLFGGVALNP